MISKNINNISLILFSIIPISLVIGPTISLINILLIDVLFLVLIYINKDYAYFKSKPVKYLFILYLYLIFNSLVSIDKEVGLMRNLGFVRVIILFIAFNYFFEKDFFKNTVLKIWSLSISIIVIDIFVESLTGQNLLGYSHDYGNRVVSFFKNKAIVGGFVNAFFLISIGFLLSNFKDKKKFLILILSLIFFISILITGERANAIKAFLGLFIFFFSLSNYDFRKKIVISSSLVILFLVLIFNSEYLKMRYIIQINKHIFEDQTYFKLYKSGLEVFKNHKVFGVGNKNYRIESCAKDNSQLINKKNYICNTHPHQIYFEMLSEHGLFGTFLIFFILYKLVFSKIKYVYNEKNYIQIGSMIYLLLTFLPILPSGAFFSDYMLTLFMINLSIFYSSSKRLNILNV